ncbi:GNAT family N-acetyltransferase [Bradyrhizobium sp. IC3069]|uniref:GNAT family N-acetyltransferase n=1 Tax=Bradyrhizobium TaxID=374 RepID=UPI001CD26ACC|nr:MULTISPECIES: GNAT family N-acetyltransferase [unclassified Bradyrhizobium]MCA1360683.1 GNAT family N-acetyltransferase [Bradyrhizobium sp. IC4059]MCA1474681.1 GNAT family N-acetyltransferase [Bradyrhizobium sp. NBAIM08]MCA1517174.1 GNAT family N-acetyltransferase [Bradyrhizobium sp. IC3069]
MSQAATYSVQTVLKDSTPIQVRALRASDEADMLAAVARTGPQSLQNRFFVLKRHFSEKERAFFMDVDFSNHVALAALAEEQGRYAVIGGGRYVIVEPGRAEMAFVVVDAWQGRGVGSLLLRHLTEIAREQGVRELTAEVLSDNMPMRSVFAKAGFKLARSDDPRTVHLSLTL